MGHAGCSFPRSQAILKLHTYTVLNYDTNSIMCFNPFIPMTRSLYDVVYTQSNSIAQSNLTETN